MRIPSDSSNPYLAWGEKSNGVSTQSTMVDPMAREGAPVPPTRADSAFSEAQSVEVSLSREALEKAGLAQKANGKSNTNSDVDPAVQKEVEELEKLDQKVRAHEQAHLAAGGNLVKGGANYQYKAGPDGQMYAVGGEVQIDTSPEKTPEATIRKAQQIRAAAMAPADPSSQDRKVAAEATAMAQQARKELAEEKDGSKPGENGDQVGRSEGIIPSQTRDNISSMPVRMIGNTYQSMVRPNTNNPVNIFLSA